MQSNAYKLCYPLCVQRAKKKKKKSTRHETKLKPWCDMVGCLLTFDSCSLLACLTKKKKNKLKEDGSCLLCVIPFLIKINIGKMPFPVVICQMSTNMILVKYSIVRNGHVMVIDCWPNGTPHNISAIVGIECILYVLWFAKIKGTRSKQITRI